MTTPQCPAAELAANFDFSDERVRENRREVYAALRSGPPKWSDAFGGHWVAASYDDVTEVLTHPEQFCSALGTNLPPNGFPYRFPPNEADPPMHSKWRKLAAPFFTTKAVARLEASVREVTRSRLAGFMERGEADLTKDLAQHIPAHVIADMMGFPRSDAAWFSDISDRLLETAEDPSRAAENAAVGAEFVTYLSRHLEMRRESPREDLLSDLVHGTVDGRPLTPEELLGVSFFFLIAGHETTIGGLTFLFWRLATDPELRDRLVADRSLVPIVIEESLRLDSPVLHLARTVVEDTNLGGADLKAGDKIMVLYASANLDEETFPDADRFDVERSNANKHVAFGAGIHKCQGAAMARLEMRVALDEVLNAIPDFQLGDGVAFRSLQGVHSVKSLPVKFSPRPASELSADAVAV